MARERGVAEENRQELRLTRACLGQRLYDPRWTPLLELQGEGVRTGDFPLSVGQGFGRAWEHPWALTLWRGGQQSPCPAEASLYRGGIAVALLLVRASALPI